MARRTRRARIHPVVTVLMRFVEKRPGGVFALMREAPEALDIALESMIGPDAVRAAYAAVERFAHSLETKKRSPGAAQAIRALVARHISTRGAAARTEAGEIAES